MPTSETSELFHSGAVQRGARGGLLCLALLLIIACTPGGSGYGSSSGSSGSSGGSGGRGGGGNGGSLVAAPRQYSSSYNICTTASAAAAGPRVFYTDITSGPNSGGENNLGAYLTIFGEGFGASRGTSTVTINGVAVATYKRWTDTQITVQPGSGVTTGGKIAVHVPGQPASNDDQTFTVRPGHVYFVSQSGNDSTGVVDDIGHPFRNVQNTLDRVSVGDQIVIRGGTWNDPSDNNAKYNSFFSFQNGEGGNTWDSIVVMAYPGERVYVPRPSGAGIHAWNSPGGFTIAGLVIDMQGGSGTPFGFPPGAAQNYGNMMQYIRVVNCEFEHMNAPSGGGSAAMEGRGHNIKYLGNRIHDNGVVNGIGVSDKLYHSIYFDNNDDTGTRDIEIAYNSIWNQGGGRGIQTYNSVLRNDGTPQATFITNVSIHHNVVHDIAMDGINISDSNHDGILVYDNVVYRTAVKAYQTTGPGGGCLRFNDPGLVAYVANNTFADCAMDTDTDSGAIRFDNAATGGISLVNNIFATSGGLGYYTGSPGGWIVVSSNNLWDASGAPPAWDANPRAGYPQFMCFNQGDFRLQSSSPAIDNGLSAVSSYVTTDIDGIPRPQGSAPDIGAYEFYP